MIHRSSCSSLSAVELYLAVVARSSLLPLHATRFICFAAVCFDSHSTTTLVSNMQSISAEGALEIGSDSSLSVDALKLSFDKRKEQEHYAKTHCSFCGTDGGSTPLKNCSHCKYVLILLYVHELSLIAWLRTVEPRVTATAPASSPRSGQATKTNASISSSLLQQWHSNLRSTPTQSFLSTLSLRTPMNKVSAVGFPSTAALIASTSSFMCS